MGELQGSGEIPPLRKALDHPHALVPPWGGRNPSHSPVGEQVPPAALEQPQPLPVPTGALR